MTDNNGWRGAINDALTNWLSPIEDHETPADALQRLIRLEVMAALDPKVSQSAADLVATARKDALEEAARWHDEQASKAQKLSDMKLSALDSRVWGDYATNHREYAAAIRALKGEGDD
jgi:ABC-type xylose transport system substrate-binding protein